MGLTRDSVGLAAADTGLYIRKKSPDDLIVALTGNPNVGKSTVFNALTGMHQHTGNWPGKTVSNARGVCSFRGRSIQLVDVPGVYSLTALSPEEEVARDFVCFGGADVAVIVCDATCLERSMNLVLQTLEITSHAVVCVNLMDEAEKKHISIDIPLLERELGVPVAAVSARSGKGLETLLERITECAGGSYLPRTVRYPADIEQSVNELEMPVGNLLDGKLNERWVALKLLEGNEKLLLAIEEYADVRFAEVADEIRRAKNFVHTDIVSGTASAMYDAAAVICGAAVSCGDPDCNVFQLRIDRILTQKSTGIPIMLLLLALVFFLTLQGANAVSDVLAGALGALLVKISSLLINLGTAPWLYSLLTDGVLTVSFWVISVMLPPMAIFFPLFTLLEDLGYLPRVAFNLDNSFRRCHSCGKQSLTMCMGLGCNAAGVVGCRIIDSPRERLIAILTNCFIPCNGRFPALMTVITVFFAAGSTSFGSAALSALLLTGLLLLAVFCTCGASWLLSATFLRGVPSSLTLEMPPYRRPQIGKVLVRSVFDRTLFVLGRAAAVAAPAGAVLWLFTHLRAGEGSVFTVCANFLNPAAALLGLDGSILMAFFLGLPANEIVLPITVMAYTSAGVLTGCGNLAETGALLRANGWTNVTAVCFLLLFLFHWPCSTTLLTIRKETGSLKWTALSILLPTAVGAALCAAVHAVSVLF